MKALLLSLLLLPVVALAQAPTIEISGANFRPLPVAVPAPLTQNDGAKALVAPFDSAFSFDLTASGILQVLDRKGFTADAKEGMAAASINFSRWADVGAEALVKVSLAQDGGVLRGEMRLFNVGTGREDLKVSKDAPADNASLLAHRLADALYRHFTREPSPFLSRITYVRKAGTNRDVYVADWDGGNARALTKGGINILPALSQDGSQVAFTTYRKNRPDIYVQSPAVRRRPSFPVGRWPPARPSLRTASALRTRWRRARAPRCTWPTRTAAARARSPTRPTASTPAPPGRRMASASPSCPTGAAARRSTS